VRFDPNEEDLAPGMTGAEAEPDRLFYRRIDRASNLRAGLVDEEATLVAMALEGEPADMAEAFNPADRVDLRTALCDLRNWMRRPMQGSLIPFGDGDPVRIVWGGLAGIDIGLLDAAYRAVGKVAAWTWRDVRDACTLLGYAEIACHLAPHALQDALTYAAAIQRAHYNRIWGSEGR